ncbi:hypothetical protein YC2023_033025 [Brassica napus]
MKLWEETRMVYLKKNTFRISDIHHQQQKPSSITQKIGQYLEILKVPDQTYMTISFALILPNTSPVDQSFRMDTHHLNLITNKLRNGKSSSNDADQADQQIKQEKCRSNGSCMRYAD